MSYWKPDCGYVCWVSEGYKIKEVNYGVIPIGDLRPPSGAYALQEALKSGHDRVEVFGFDSIAGVFSTTSTIAFKEHDSTNDIIEERMDKWITFYKTIAEHYNEIEIIWHTKEGLILIPARYDSHRLPGKALKKIAGKTMIREL